MCYYSNFSCTLKRCCVYLSSPSFYCYFTSTRSVVVERSSATVSMAHTVFKSDRTQNYILLVAHYLIRTLSRSAVALLLLLLLSGALSWLISWLQPLWWVNWRRHCVYLCIYGPAAPLPPWGVYLLFAHSAFCSIHICFFFVFVTSETCDVFFFLVWLPLWLWSVSFPLW